MQAIVVPSVRQGVAGATVRRWLVEPGQAVAADQVIVELEIEDAFVHLTASAAGSVASIIAPAGTTVSVGGEIGQFNDGGGGLGVSATSDIRHPTSAEPPVGVVAILMPQVGNSMEEGTIIEWHAKVGDTIAAGQEICEIETDKATMMIEATDAGRLSRIIADAGDVVPVKQPIAFLADDDAAVDVYLAAGSAAPAAVSAQPTVAASAAPGQSTIGNRQSATTDTGRIKASPAARKQASERGLDLASIAAGSGPGGRILSTDLDRAKPGSATAASAKPQAAGTKRTPMSKMRRAIGLNLQASKQTIPHFYIRREIDAAPMFAFYKARKPATGCTINDVIVLAIGRAMAEFPAVRSQVDDRDIVEFDHANIGIAVGVEDGLVVPVVLKVDTLSLADLVPQTKRVVENARKGKLENIGKGNFTVSNLGMFGVDGFAAIINPPESGILAISAVRDQPIVRDGNIEAGKRMTLTLSCDHRIVDGLTAAQFMARLKELLETPEQLG